MVIRMNIDEQVRLRETLHCRVGQLISELGYFELGLFTMISYLKRDPVLIDYAKEWQFDARMRLVKKLLAARKAPEEIRRAFDEIATAIKPIMDRRAIVAHNVALLDIDSKTQAARAGVLNLKEWIEVPPGTGKYLHPLEDIESDITAARALNLRMIALTPTLHKAIPSEHEEPKAKAAELNPPASSTSGA
jgi:hypothetical protein